MQSARLARAGKPTAASSRAQCSACWRWKSARDALARPRVGGSRSRTGGAPAHPVIRAAPLLAASARAGAIERRNLLAFVRRSGPGHTLAVAAADSRHCARTWPDAQLSMRSLAAVVPSHSRPLRLAGPEHALPLVAGGDRCRRGSAEWRRTDVGSSILGGVRHCGPRAAGTSRPTTAWRWRSACPWRPGRGAPARPGSCSPARADVRRQRRHLRVGHHLEQHRPVGGQRLVPGGADLRRVVDADAAAGRAARRSRA